VLIYLSSGKCYTYVVTETHSLRATHPTRNIGIAGVSGFFIDIKSFRSHYGL